MTEIWFRNPHNYVRELAEVGEPYRIAWDRGILIKKRIDANKHAELYFGTDADWRALVIGNQGTAEVGPDHGLSDPVAVYPTWEYGEDFDLLEEMVANPWGEDEQVCSADVPPDQRPVWGQEHRVVIAKLPDAGLTSSRPFYRLLKELQEDNPECIIHIHGSYSYRMMFGMGYASADFEPRGDAAKGSVYIPAGKRMNYAKTVGCQQWVHLLGFSTVDLKIPRNRCIYNIRSAQWAAEHFNENVKFKTVQNQTPDPDAKTVTIPTTASSRTKSLVAQPGDKEICDECSLATSCKYYRQGAVCSVPGTENSSLAKYFQSRDSGHIIDALGTVLAAQTKRLERGMEEEDEFGELNPEVTKIMNQLFTNGVKLAKLVDPTLTKPMVQINNGAAGAVAGSNPKQLMAAVVRAIEDTGVKREDITPDMVESMLRKMTGEAPAIVQGETA